MKIARRLTILVAALMTLGAGPLAADAAASHFRGGNISYQQTGLPTNAEFESTVSFRCTAFFSSPCDADVGDSVDISEAILDFGDGTQSDNDYVVVAVNAAEDFFVARKNVSHNYADLSARTAFFTSCCTIIELQNNSDASFRVETLVNLGQDPNSPKTSVPAVVNVGSSGNQMFLVPASDPGGQSLRYRLATDGETAGSNVNPSDYSINPTTGRVTFDTTGKTQGLYHSSIVVEALDGSNNVVSSTLVTFLIRVGQQAGNQAPEYDSPPTPPDGTEFTVTPGSNLTINLQASDPDSGDTVQIVPGPLPPGATFNETSGNPATGTFSFTPSLAQLNEDFVVNFTAQDQSGGSTFRSYIIRVRATAPPDTTPPDTTIGDEENDEDGEDNPGGGNGKSNPGGGNGKSNPGGGNGKDDDDGDDDTPPPPVLGEQEQSPLVLELSLDPSSFAAAPRGASIAAFLEVGLDPLGLAAVPRAVGIAASRAGTRASYSLSRPARVRFTVERQTVGRRVGGRCVASRRSNGGRPRCTRYVALGGSFSRSGAAGQNAFRFTGRLSGRTLAPGRYRLVGVPTDAAGDVGAPSRARFRVLRTRPPRFTG